jgi:Rieske Fe-S protein
MTDRDENGTAPVASRRAVLLGAGAVGAVGFLAACGTGTDSAASPGGNGGNSSAGAATSGPIKAADIPVGGGKIFPASQLVVTQPAAGSFKAFSSVCTHQGCFVGSVANGKIVCPCHMSEFNLDGTVAHGPATQPLVAKKVTASGDELTVA